MNRRKSQLQANITVKNRRPDRKQIDKHQNERKPNVNTKHSGMIETVKDGIVAAIKGTGDIVQATVDTITKRSEVWPTV